MRGRPGAYGFGLAGIEAVSEQLVECDESWPDLRIVRDGTGEHERAGAPAGGTVDVGAQEAMIWLPEGDRIELVRSARTVRFATTARFDDAVVLHPFLSLPASIHSHWLGRQALHGGAFRHAGRTWGVLGDKEGGKSSTLAGLLRRGLDIVSDDVLILEGRTLFSGPRCVDLRGESAGVFGGTDLGRVGSRPRWRLPAGPVPPATRLEGVVHLEWGERLRVEPLSARDRLSALIRHSVIRPAPDAALALLDLAGLPALRLVRPRDLARLDASLDELLSALGRARPGAGAARS